MTVKQRQNSGEMTGKTSDKQGKFIGKIWVKQGVKFPFFYAVTSIGAINPKLCRSI